ncbi:hypothetical protein Hanom_Chr09g00781721 [Helianthus anomalus]
MLGTAWIRDAAGDVFWGRRGYVSSKFPFIFLAGNLQFSPETGNWGRFSGWASPRSLVEAQCSTRSLVELDGL